MDIPAVEIFPVNENDDCPAGLDVRVMNMNDQGDLVKAILCLL